MFLTEQRRKVFTNSIGQVPTKINDLKVEIFLEIRENRLTSRDENVEAIFVAKVSGIVDRFPVSVIPEIRSPARRDHLTKLKIF
jgi:hypothetical protein